MSFGFDVSWPTHTGRISIRRHHFPVLRRDTIAHASQKCETCNGAWCRDYYLRLKTVGAPLSAILNLTTSEIWILALVGKNIIIIITICKGI